MTPPSQPDLERVAEAVTELLNARTPEAKGEILTTRADLLLSPIAAGVTEFLLTQH